LIKEEERLLKTGAIPHTTRAFPSPSVEVPVLRLDYVSSLDAKLVNLVTIHMAVSFGSPSQQSYIPSSEACSQG
jgi:hypothetical protein